MSRIEVAAQRATHIDSGQDLATMLKSATLLPDENVELDGRTTPCHVVRYTDADFRFHTPRNPRKHEGKIWIDKLRMVVVKVERHSDDFNGTNGPDKGQLTTLYRVVKLDRQEPPDTFVFSPPAGARLVVSLLNLCWTPM